MKKIKVIESKQVLQSKTAESPKLRVCAYCRVSSSHEEQLNSFDAQVEYYTNYIKSNQNWIFAGIYADEGISGKSKEKRTEFMRMVKDCDSKKIDMIITKSISRFARNTADCIEIVRKLKLSGIAVYFEKENINTMSAESELILTVLSSIAQEELASLSQNIRWANQKRYQQGKIHITAQRFLGYDIKDGKLVINEDEARIVKRIFDEYVAGKGAGKIAKGLEADGIKTVTGRSIWSHSTIRKMLSNEKYCGDAILQKSFTADTVTFKRKKNNGEMPMYYIKNSHMPIIDRGQFDLVQELIADRAVKHSNLPGDREKYMNRYPFTYRIICGNCGNTFKRQIHNAGKRCATAAWGCSTYIGRGKTECAMKPVHEDTIKAIFVRMFNKLYANRDTILKVFSDNVQKVVDARLRDPRIVKLDENIKALIEQERLLIKLKAKGYADEAIFFEEHEKLRQSIEALRATRNQFVSELAGHDEWLKRVRDVRDYINTSKGILEEFDEDIFTAIVERITVKSDTHLCFELKNGLVLDEKFQKGRGKKQAAWGR